MLASFDNLVFVHVQTRWRIRFWFLSSQPPTCCVTCVHSTKGQFRAGNHVADPAPRGLAFSVRCTAHPQLSHDHSQSTPPSQDRVQDSPPNVSISWHVVTHPRLSHPPYHLAHNGPTCYAPQTPTIQHHLQQTACREDTWRKARLSPHRKTRYRP